MGRVRSPKAVWRYLSQAGNVRGRVAGRHTAPRHGVSELHGHVAWTWQWLFTSVDSEHTFWGQCVRNEYLLEKVGISTESQCAQFLTSCLLQSAGDLFAVSSQLQNWLYFEWWWSSTFSSVKREGSYKMRWTTLDREKTKTSAGGEGVSKLSCLIGEEHKLSTAMFSPNGQLQP